MRLLLLFVATLSCTLLSAEPVDHAHAEIWRRFIDSHGIMLDFTDLDGRVTYPTPEECREGKPNALGWWSPIENGAMFNGLYMDAAVLRWQHTRAEADAEKARLLMRGLIKLNSLNDDLPGFVGRGVSTDGKSHYAMGSNDQTMPWLLGLWRYLHGGIATDDEKIDIKGRLLTTIAAMEKLRWQMPAEAPFHKRGGFAGFHFEEVSRLLFTLRLRAEINGDTKSYRQELARIDPETKLSKQAIAAAGMKFFYAKTHNWTSCAGVGALRGLWEMETDSAIKADFARGLTASAKLAAESLPLAQQWDAADKSVFLRDWRSSMLPHWKPQTTEQEATDVAHAQLRAFNKVSPRRNKETSFIREPTAAAWIVTLCPDRELVLKHRTEIEAMIARYDYSQLYYCTFFWVEAAWWRLR